MVTDAWQRLLQLESRDTVSGWFEDIHNRKLNARRAREVIASARQGREYFRSASTASLAVRPLLAFYGVASLCRALTLMNSRDAGEEGLKQGHGLETVAWSSNLSGELPVALASIGHLRVRTCGGLFSDLVGATAKRRVLHVYGDRVSFPIEFQEKSTGYETTLQDILDRLPDLFRQTPRNGYRRWVRIKRLDYEVGLGIKIVVHEALDHPVCKEYASLGYKLSVENDQWDSSGAKTVLEIGEAGLQQHFPQVLDTRVARTMGGDPSPHLISKFAPETWYSQICVTYMVSYVLGMLARYYPTHWNALMAGEKGDAIWPTINAAQSYVEAALPELILDALNGAIQDPVAVAELKQGESTP